MRNNIIPVEVRQSIYSEEKLKEGTSIAKLASLTHLKHASFHREHADIKRSTPQVEDNHV